MMKNMIDPNWNLLAENQLVGDGCGFWVFRDLYETQEGKRVSVKKSKTIYEKVYKNSGKTEAQILEENLLSK
jgi:hypothetical protein